nr:nucleoside diphosphate kinase regulator [uncultured Moellerella sp.]
MKKPTIIINDLDAERLDKLLEQAAYADNPIGEALNEELDRAEILTPQEMPADVVTMNSTVRFLDLISNEEYTRTLVYPASLKDSTEQLSVMAPIGAALLGLRVGDDISWALNGVKTHVKVLEMVYQPEAAGEYHR